MAFGKRCREAGVRPSMGSVGDAYDNAMAESFFSTLEAELLSRRRFTSQAEARMACFSYIEGWYNPARLHSGLGYRSPITYEADINQTASLVHGREEAVFADAGYTGAAKRPELEDCDVDWNIAVKRSIIKALPKDLRDWAEAIERALSQVRAWVEHPFHIVKNLFRHKRLRYRGLAKNTAQLRTLFALANLVIVKKTLLAPGRVLSRPDSALFQKRPWKAQHKAGLLPA